MPANDRDKKVEEEGKVFCRTQSFYPIQCKHFKPTLEGLQSMTFSDYIRSAVLGECQVGYDDDKEMEEMGVEGRHGTRSSSNNENSKRHCPNNPKIKYDYGKLM